MQTVQSKLVILLTSGTTWSIVAMFVYAGLEAIAPSLSGTTGNIVQGFLGLLAIYAHSNHVQSVQAGAIGTSAILPTPEPQK